MQEFVEHPTEMLSYTGYTMTKLVMIIFLERMSGVGESVVDLFVGDTNAGHRILILIKY